MPLLRTSMKRMTIGNIWIYIGSIIVISRLLIPRHIICDFSFLIKHTQIHIKIKDKPSHIRGRHAQPHRFVVFSECACKTDWCVLLMLCCDCMQIHAHQYTSAHISKHISTHHCTSANTHRYTPIHTVHTWVHTDHWALLGMGAPYECQIQYNKQYKYDGKARNTALAYRYTSVNT